MGASITITDLDPSTLRRLESEAHRRGIDVAALAKELLSQAAPPDPASLPNGQLHHDLDPLAGTWSDADARAFEAAVADFGHVDQDPWK